VIDENNFEVTERLLKELGKTSFRGWADKYKDQVDGVKARMLKANNRNAHLTRRREEVLTKLLIS
jgi:hypothetical protein